MSKVIQNIKSKSHLSKHFNSISLLHRGQKSKDPYEKRLINSPRLLLKTLGTSRVPRCSSTFSGYINNSKNLRVAGISSALVLLVLISLLVYPIVKNLNNVEAAEAKNSTTTLSVTSTNSASVELLVRSSSGTFATSSTSQKLNFGVTTDNYAGYKLTLLGKDDSYANLKNSSTNTNLTSISTSSTVTSSSFNNGNWGYTLDGTNYRSAPNNTTGYTIDTTSAPNASTAKTYTLGVGAKADYNTKAGTYTNTYVLTAVGNGTPYVIYYKDNTGDSSVANLPTTQDESTTAINVNLSSTIPTRTGYTFSKWCDGTVSNDGTTCSGTLYSASASFGIDRTKPKTNNTTTLYAVWTPKTYTLNITNNNTTSNPASSTTINFKGSTNITVTPNAGYYLSEVSCPSGYTCTGYSTGSDKTAAQTVTVTNNSTDAGGTIAFTATPSMTNVGELQGLSDSLCTSTAAYATDNRDNQDYVIQRLDDGNCWMMTNLNLGATTLTTDLTSSNTNLSSTVTASTFNGWRVTSGTGTYTAGEFISTSGNDETTGLPYGVLYNYYAVSASTIKSNSNSNNATYDICPKGWRLPTGGSSGELQVLYDISNYNTYAKMRASYTSGGAAFVLAGGSFGYGSSGIRNQGSYGYYWSSTRATGGASSTYMHYLILGEDEVRAADSNDRTYGFSVRCIKKSPLEEFGVSTMQDIGNLTITNKTALLDSMSEGKSYSANDSRDNQTYTIAKINGNLWMTRNLAIGCNGSGSTYGSSVSSKSLTTSNSNVSSTWSTPTALLSAASSSTQTADYSAGRIQCDATYGAWYNYAAASAGTITGTDNSNNQVYDICPKGWRLQTFAEQKSDIIDYLKGTKVSLFNGVLGGYYKTGSITSADKGFWWASTADGKDARYSMYYDGDSFEYGDQYRTFGRYVRCILNTSTPASATYLQDVTTMMENNATVGEVYTLKDNRDEQSYQVAKLADGKLWMIDNLNLGATPLTTDLTSLNTNLSTTIAASTFNGWKRTSGAWSYLYGSYIPLDSIDSTSGTVMGTLYDYVVASADTIRGESNTTDATDDICPKGWRLPKGGNTGSTVSYNEFYNLYTYHYNTFEKMRASVANGGAAFALPGYFVDKEPGSQGGRGFYWTSTSYGGYSGRHALRLIRSTAEFEATYDMNRRYGGSIRCVLK